MSSETDPLGHGHSPAAWIAVTIMLIAIAVGTVFYFFENPVGVWISVAFIAVGLGVGIVLSKLGWGANGPKYQPKGH